MSLFKILLTPLKKGFREKLETELQEIAEKHGKLPLAHGAIPTDDGIVILTTCVDAALAARLTEAPAPGDKPGNGTAATIAASHEAGSEDPIIATGKAIQ